MGEARSWKVRLRRYAILALGLYGLWLTLLYFKQDSMVFPRQFSGPAMKEGRLPARMESVWINAGTEEKPVRVEAWYLPPEPGPGSAAARHPALMYFHGNAELIDDNELRAREWARRGFVVMLPEYRGYGRSAGEPSQSAIVADAVRFYDLLAARADVDPARVYLHGRSLGGGVAAQVAAKRPTAGIVLESTFTSIACFAWGVGGVPWVCKHPFRTDEALQGYERPVLIFHGVDDDIIPVSHGRALAKLLPQARYIETKGDHMNYPPDVGAFWGEIDRFIARP